MWGWVVIDHSSFAIHWERHLAIVHDIRNIFIFNISLYKLPAVSEMSFVNLCVKNENKQEYSKGERESKEQIIQFLTLIFMRILGKWLYLFVKVRKIIWFTSLTFFPVIKCFLLVFVFILNQRKLIWMSKYNETSWTKEHWLSITYLQECALKGVLLPLHTT